MYVSTFSHIRIVLTQILSLALSRSLSLSQNSQLSGGRQKSESVDMYRDTVQEVSSHHNPAHSIWITLSVM